MGNLGKSKLIIGGAVLAIGGLVIFAVVALQGDEEPSTTVAQATTTQSTATSSSSTSANSTSTTSTTVEPTTTTVVTTAEPSTTVEPTTTTPPTTATPTTTPPTTAAPSTPAPVVTEPPVASPSQPTAAQWEALRQCEATGSYTAVNPNGLYHGAYQFDQPTWNGVADSQGRGDLVGVSPSQAAPADQDFLAQALWNQRGWQPWPVCGARASNL